MSAEARQFRRFGSEVAAYFTFFPLAIKASVGMAVVGLVAVMYNATACTAFADEAHGMNVVMARTTIGGLEPDDDDNHTSLVVNQFFMVCVLAIGFALAFKWKGLERTVAKGDPDIMSHQSGVVVRKPKDTTVEAVTEYMGQFGRVVEVVRFRKLGETVRLAKEMFELRDTIRYYRTLQTDDSSRKELRELEEWREKTAVKLGEEAAAINESTKDSVLFLATFERAEDAEKCLEVLEQYSGCCYTPPEHLRLGGEKVEVEALTSQPEEIIWENQHMTTPIVPAVVLMVLINVLAFTVIGVLGVLAAAHQHVYYYPELSSNSLNATAIQGETNTTLVASWCLSHTPSAETESLCGGYLSLQDRQMWTYFWTGVALIFGNLMMKYFFHWYARFFRFSFRALERDFIFQQVTIHYLMVGVALALSVLSA